MSDDRWIWIPAWETFQHYKDRDPRWIKNYTRLLNDDAYLSLTLHQRGVLHGLWMMYATSNRQLRDSTLTISRHLHSRVSTATLEALSNAGFIEFIASDVLAERLQRASPETETEKEVETPLPPSEEGGSGTLRDKGENKRAKSKARKRQTSLQAFVARSFDDYPNLDILEQELTDRGCRQDEAADLIAAERSRRLESVEAA